MQAFCLRTSVFFCNMYYCVHGYSRKRCFFFFWQRLAKYINESTTLPSWHGVGSVSQPPMELGFGLRLGRHDGYLLVGLVMIISALLFILGKREDHMLKSPGPQGGRNQGPWVTAWLWVAWSSTHPPWNFNISKTNFYGIKPLRYWASCYISCCLP